MISPNVLIIDDDEVARKLLKEILEREGCITHLAASGEDAIALSKQKAFPVIISDIRMLDIDGLDVLRHFRTYYPRSVVILMTAFGSMETAIEAIKGGAFDYLSKPFKIDDFKTILKKALKQAEALEQPQAPPLAQEFKHVPIIAGSSPKMLEIFKVIAKAALSQASVLIIGEKGSGKELIARSIHENSARSTKKFVITDCGLLTESLMEHSLLSQIQNPFIEADGGTLFLDEISNLSPQAQIKLLRALQDRELPYVNGKTLKKIDVRVIAATQRNLLPLIEAGKFREDLYYYLNVINLEIPPVRERRNDIPELVGHFLAKYTKKNKKQISHLSTEALNVLMQYSWPGNVRELENVIERTIALANSSEIDVDDLPKDLLLPSTCMDKKQLGTSLLPTQKTKLEDLEKQHILKILQQVQYNKSKAAEALGIDRATLYRKAQKYGIDLHDRT